jgi:hypothetical protein
MIVQMEVCTQNAAPGATAVLQANTTATAATSTDRGLTAREKYRLTHGALMILAWTLLIPLAVGEAVLKLEGKWCVFYPVATDPPKVDRQHFLYVFYFVIPEGRIIFKFVHVGEHITQSRSKIYTSR